jgi:hypothetical protein
MLFFGPGVGSTRDMHCQGGHFRALAQFLTLTRKAFIRLSMNLLTRPAMVVGTSTAISFAGTNWIPESSLTGYSVSVLNRICSKARACLFLHCAISFVKEKGALVQE